MNHGSRVWLVIGFAAVQLLTAGCGGGGGGGFFGLFGGGDSGSGDLLGLLASSGSSGSDLAGGISELAGGDPGGGLGTITSDVATVSNPEPASMALFGGGLAGLACLRRRRARRASPTTRH